uniref:Uncharacterized protein n=1 Tax=Panagrolaimus sp. PS1159 TaxID=55785 RepID=A0AC35ETA7_9BILA
MFLFSILNKRSKSTKNTKKVDSEEVKPTLGQVLNAIKAQKALADQKQRRNTFPMNKQSFNKMSTKSQKSLKK